MLQLALRLFFSSDDVRGESYKILFIEIDFSSFEKSLDGFFVLEIDSSHQESLAFLVLEIESRGVSQVAEQRHEERNTSHRERHHKPCLP